MKYAVCECIQTYQTSPEKKCEDRLFIPEDLQAELTREKLANYSLWRWALTREKEKRQ